ncbi:Arm DNA-binding domain-containing protein [Cellulophaga baltica]|uniref:Arm DNA-binding domain-containing protein n=1 Tax=Cellulophaga baltica TaxID=76594 RepID=A0A1G7LXJ5_9FLAO|nr:Arm DNA-binding domain-containing protein [Cellulophaga baltica]SDF54232.1 hypothetical protein SAMN04487992_12317 [Cellulophaga baltica]
MKTTATFSILFWADFSRVKDNQASLYARITVNGKRAVISLKRKVLISDWDVHKNRAKGTSQKSRILNSYLDETYNHLFNSYRDLMAGNLNCEPTSNSSGFSKSKIPCVYVSK